MGFETTAISGASKGAGYFLSPIGRINLIVACCFLVILVFMGVTESVQSNSLYPLYKRTLEKVIGADSQLGESVDKLESSARPVKPSSFFSKAMPTYVWFWLKFYFEVASSIFMIYFFVWLLYGFWTLVNNESVFRNVFLTIISFLLISFFMGMVMFNMALSGYKMPSDRVEMFNLQMQHSYPLHGTIKFVSHFVNGDLFSKMDNWMQTSFGSAVTGIPVYNVSYNQSLNLSNGV